MFVKAGLYFILVTYFCTFVCVLPFISLKFNLDILKCLHTSTNLFCTFTNRYFSYLSFVSGLWKDIYRLFISFYKSSNNFPIVLYLRPLFLSDPANVFVTVISDIWWDKYCGMGILLCEGCTEPCLSLSKGASNAPKDYFLL